MSSRKTLKPAGETQRELNERLALVGVLQELTVAALQLFDPRHAVDDFLYSVAARMGCRVVLCLETRTRSMSLVGAAGLSRASAELPLPVKEDPFDLAKLRLPYPEVSCRTLVRWDIPAELTLGEESRARHWLLLYFEREPEASLRYRGMLGRVAHYLALAFKHRRLYESLQERERKLRQATSRLKGMNEELERRVAERTQDLERANEELLASFESLHDTKDQLVQAEKLAAVGQLAAGFAHEINNPLGVILGFAQGLERRAEEDSAIRMPVESIHREARRCKELVQNLLTFSRQAGKGKAPLDLNQVTKYAVALLSSRARMQDVRITFEQDDGAPRVLGNPTQLEQVLINLGNNALDAMVDGGHLVVRTQSEGPTVLVEIQDDGCGIHEEELPKIFNPFFTTKEVGKGTGLGLSLSYEIVQQHGGRMRLESKPDEGTRVIIELPAIERDDVELE